MAALSRKELADLVVDELGFSGAVSRRLVDGFFESLVSFLLSGEDVKIVRFGTFRLVERGARHGTDPSSGKPMEIASRKTVVFSPGRYLRARVNRVP